MKLCNVSNGRRSLKAVLISLLIIFICASAFCGCVSAAEDVTVSDWNQLYFALQNSSIDKVIIADDFSSTDYTAQTSEIDGVPDLVLTPTVKPTNWCILNETVGFNVIKVNGSKILNLNGKTINSPKNVNKSIFLINDSAKLTIIDSGNAGKIDSSNKVPFVVMNGTLIVSDGMIVGQNGGSGIILIGGDKNTLAGYSLVCIEKDAEINGAWPLWIESYNKQDNSAANGAKIIVNGTLKSPNYALQVNGHIDNMEGTVPEIIINDPAVLVGGNDYSLNDYSTGAYAAGYANWTINGGTFTGSDGLTIKSGKFTINGGKFTGKGTNPEIYYHRGGYYPCGAAIQVIKSFSTAYPGNVKLIINGGEFISEYNDAIMYTAPSKKPDGSSVDVNNYADVLQETTVGPETTFKGSNHMNPVSGIVVNVKSYEDLKNALNAGFSVKLGSDITIKPDQSITVTFNQQKFNLTDKKIYAAGTRGIFKGFNKTLPNAQEADVTLTANTEKIITQGTYYPVYQYILKNNSTAISSPTETAAYPGQEIKITNKSQEGFRFVKFNVTENGTTNQVDVNPVTGTFVMPTYDVYIDAEFESTSITTQYNITVTQSAGGTITVTPVYAQSGTLINISATANDGWKFDGIFTVENETLNKKETVVKRDVKNYTFIMPAYNVTVKAVFTPPAPSSGDSSSSSTWAGGSSSSDDDVWVHTKPTTNTTPTVTPTPIIKPTEVPTVTPTLNPVEPTAKPTQTQSPMPIVGLLMGLCAAALLARRK